MSLRDIIRDMTTPPPAWSPHRVWVPREIRGAFKTSDGQRYQRGPDGVIRRVPPKVRGKKARAADKQRRRSA